MLSNFGGPALDWLIRYIAPEKLFILPGNHDYYGHALGADDDLRSLAASRGVTLVQKQELRYGTLRLLCCTLWTDFALMGDPESAMLKASVAMLDYDKISRSRPNRSGSFAPISPLDVLLLHQNHRAWLQATLASPHFSGPSGRTAIVTHHGPHPAVAAPLNDLSPCFHSDLSDLIYQYQPKAWFFGHSHRRLRARIGMTDLRCVSIGYPHEREVTGSQPLAYMCMLEAAN